LDYVFKAGGWITTEKELYNGTSYIRDLSTQISITNEINYMTIHRVCGELSVSRSIGYKNNLLKISPLFF